MKITHLFYHTEAVEQVCALNSWNSILNAIEDDDEVIVLDNGNSLDGILPLDKIDPKFYRHERVRTDMACERSYTFGLNMMMPEARCEWIVLWRSDYIYHEKYINEIRKIRDDQSKEYSIILPYECFIGNYYATGNWAKRNLSKLVRNESYMLEHSHVCPVYEMQDQPHFAVRKELWLKCGGMNDAFYGYGIQFPDVLHRMKSIDIYKSRICFDMFAFHQNHLNSFSTGISSETQRKEFEDYQDRMTEYFGSEVGCNEYLESLKQAPLTNRRDESYYIPKAKSRNGLLRFVHYLKNKVL